MHNHYLATLGLSPGASEAEVKAAYRRLSKLYHPDLSRDAATQARFVEITEAYNFLTKVGPRPHQEDIAFDYDPKAEEFERRRRAARERAQRKVAEELRMKLYYFGKIFGVFNYLAATIALLNLSLLADYLLPARYTNQTVQAVHAKYESSRSRHGRRVHRYNVLQFEQYRIPFELKDLTGLELDRGARVAATPMFNIPLQARFYRGAGEVVLPPAYGIYEVFGYLIPIILLIMALYQFFFTNPDHRLTLAILLVVLAGVQLLVIVLD